MVWGSDWPWRVSNTCDEVVCWLQSQLITTSTDVTLRTTVIIYTRISGSRPERERKSQLGNFNSALPQVLFCDTNMLLTEYWWIREFWRPNFMFRNLYEWNFKFCMYETYKLSTRQDIIDILSVVKLCKSHWICRRVQFLLTTIQTIPICHTPS
jgi:hypothetical protein